MSQLPGHPRSQCGTAPPREVGGLPHLLHRWAQRQLGGHLERGGLASADSARAGRVSDRLLRLSHLPAPVLESRAFTRPARPTPRGPPEMGVDQEGGRMGILSSGAPWQRPGGHWGYGLALGGGEGAEPCPRPEPTLGGWKGEEWEQGRRPRGGRGQAFGSTLTRSCCPHRGGASQHDRGLGSPRDGGQLVLLGETETPALRASLGAGIWGIGSPRLTGAQVC